MADSCFVQVDLRNLTTEGKSTLPFGGTIVEDLLGDNKDKLPFGGTIVEDLPLNDDLIDSIKNFAKNQKRDVKDTSLQDFYSSYLWTYCYGEVEGKKGDEDYETKGCSKTTAGYSFNIEKIIDDGVGDPSKVNFPENVKDVQNGVDTVSKFMTACYVLGFVATVVTSVIGWFGLLSRWGSCVTTIFADVCSPSIFHSLYPRSIADIYASRLPLVSSSSPPPAPHSSPTAFTAPSTRLLTSLASTPRLARNGCRSHGWLPPFPLALPCSGS